MKIITKIISFLFVLLLLVTLGTSAFATDRNYRVRVYPGNTGTIDNSSSPFTAQKSDFQEPTPIPDEGYYVKGFKQTGRDTILTNIPAITCDQDYIVAYGIDGGQVAYKIQYLESGTNRVLAPERTYYGDVGDKPVASYLYIDGYQPQVRAITGTLTKNGDNTWIFYYTRIVTPTATPTTAGGGGAAAGGGGGGAAVAGGAAANAVNPANPANPANNPNVNNQQGANNPVNTPNNPPAPTQFTEPEEILDLDVPLAAPDMMGTGTAKVPNAPKVIEANQRGRLPNWALIAGMVVLVGLISVLYWYLLFYRKKKKYASVNEDYEILGFDDD